MQLGPDRALMLHHFPPQLRPAAVALWGIDEAMAAVVAGAGQPALAAIKLAWWREALARLDHDPAPPEPRLRAVAETLLPLGVRGDELGGLTAGWLALLDEHPDAGAAGAAGARLFVFQARLLGVDDPLLAKAGALAFLTRAMRRGVRTVADERAALLGSLRGRRISRGARPITLAARLAARDLSEPEGTPGRALALVAHRLTGVITGGS